MSHGFQVINNNNFIQVDEKSSVYAIAFTGTTGTMPANSTSGYFRSTINLGSGNNLVNSLLCVRPASTWTTSAKKIWRGGLPGVAGQNVFVYSNTSSAVDYFVMRDMRDVVSPAGSGYGIEVYDSTGSNVVYSSNKEVGKAHQTISVPPTTSGSILYDSASYDANIYGMLNTTFWSNGVVNSGFWGPQLWFFKASGSSSNYRILVQYGQMIINPSQQAAPDHSLADRVFLSARRGV